MKIKRTLAFHNLDREAFHSIVEYDDGTIKFTVITIDGVTDYSNDLTMIASAMVALDCTKQTVTFVEYDPTLN